MRNLVRLLGLGLVLVCVAVFSARAAEEKKEGKEVTLKGTICCTKCELGETDTCGNAIKVKDGDLKGKTVYFKDKGKGEKHHGEICQGPKAGSVTGVVSEDEKTKGKLWITLSKDGVKFDK